MKELKFKPCPMAGEARPQGPLPAPIGEKRNADGSTNYGYLDRGRWWDTPDLNGMGRGWVRDSRFGSGPVIPGTNRAAQRKAAAK